MVQIIIKRKGLEKIVDISNWNVIELDKFMKAYFNRDDYKIEFRRIEF